MPKSWIAAVCLILTPGAAVAAESDGLIPLPNGVEYPEGIAYDPGRGVLYTAGTLSGQIARIDPATGEARLVGTGIADRIGAVRRGILGMKVDRLGRLWMAGGATASVFVVDPQDGRLLHHVAVPSEGGLMNDLVFAGDRAFVTDTRKPALWAIPLEGDRVGQAERWIDFTGTPIDGASPNLNGITASADGKALIVVHMSSGRLFRIDVATRRIDPIDLGGELVTGADGLVLDGRTLYVVLQAKAEVLTVALDAGLTSGELVRRSPLPGLAAPATAALAGQHLYVVNTQFNRMDSNDPARPFTVSRAPLSALAAGKEERD